MFKNPDMTKLMKKLVKAVEAKNVDALAADDFTELDVTLTVSDVDLISAVFEQFEEAMEIAYGG